MPGPGEPAPDFTLPAGPDASLTLSDLRGRPVVLAFYPADWSPVCSDQMALYQAVGRSSTSTAQRCSACRSTASGATGRSRRAGTCSSRCWPTSSPRARFARRYGSYDDGEGESERNCSSSTRQGDVFWSHRSPNGVNPGADGILAALEAMRGRPA